MRVTFVLCCLFAGAVAVELVARRGQAEPPLPRAHAVFGETGAPYVKVSLVATPTSKTGRRVFTSSGCSDDMVRVSHRFCIDRYEASMIDHETERALSPYYPPIASLARSVHDEWRQRLIDGTAGVDVALPPLPPWQSESFSPRAVARPAAIPQGYVSKRLAETACKNAGKRLCTLEEWTTACRGEKNTKFPYGGSFQKDACNVFRDEHPGMILHGSFSVDLLDPRLNTVVAGGQPLLRPTGATSTCKSTWGDDAVYDMVGNLDEWIEDAEGTFVGGFYARSTRNGCESIVTLHGPTYLDYSTGVRCCDQLR